MLGEVAISNLTIWTDVDGVVARAPRSRFGVETRRSPEDTGQ